MMSANEFNDQETENLFRVVRGKYGRYLSDDQLLEVQKNIARLVETMQTIRAVKVDNFEEPFLAFVPYREDKNP